MLNRNELLEIGFKELPYYTVMNKLTYDLGRRRVLSVWCLGQGNEVVYLCEKSEAGDHYIDLVCVHNRDYDGLLTMEKVKYLIGYFEGAWNKSADSEVSQTFTGLNLRPNY